MGCVEQRRSPVTHRALVSFHPLVSEVIKNPQDMEMQSTCVLVVDNWQYDLSISVLQLHVPSKMSLGRAFPSHQVTT